MALSIEQIGDEDRRIGDVVLGRPREMLDFYVERATGGSVALLTAEQGMEHRIAVGPRQAAPDDRAALVDQRVECAVADDAQRKIRRRAAGGLVHCRSAERAVARGRTCCLPPSSIATSRRTSRLTSA